MSRQIKDYDEDTVAEWVGNQTPAALALKALGTIVVLSVVLGVVGFVGGWFNAGAKVVSPENVKAQWAFAYDYDSSLDAIASQWCTASNAEKAEVDPAIKSQRTDQRIAIENNYQRVAAEYNGRLRDAFRAKLVAPSDVPDSAPSLVENVAENCTAAPSAP